MKIIDSPVSRMLLTASIASLLIACDGGKDGSSSAKSDDSTEPMVATTDKAAGGDKATGGATSTLRSTDPNQAASNKGKTTVDKTDATGLSLAADAATLKQAGPSPAVKAPAPSTVKVDPPSLKLGKMQPGVPKSGKVTITNTGTEPIQIKKAVASCGCTTPNWPKGPIGPGESAEIDITLKPTLKQGQKLKKRVTLTMVDGGAPTVIPVEGEVGLYVKMSPDFLDASKMDSDAAQVVVLESADKIPFAIVSVEPDVLDEANPDKSLKHELTMNWEKWEAAGRRPTLKFLTDHPNAPELSMTVRRAIVRPQAPTPTPRQATSRLVAAAQANNLEGVKAAIAANDDLTSTSLGGMTALLWSCKNGNEEIVDVLLAAGADPNLGNKVGKRAAAIAAENGRLAVLKKIIAAGGEVDSLDDIGGTPLLWASALSKNPETVAFLIESGADVNVIDTNGMTPLIWAAGIGQPESVDLLLKNGADPNIIEMHAKETALMRAARVGQPGTMEIMVAAQPDLEMRNMLGQTALIIACSSGRLDTIQTLVEGGADLGAKDTRGWTVLDHAHARTDADRAAVIAYLDRNAPASVKAATPIVPRDMTPATGQ